MRLKYAVLAGAMLAATQLPAQVAVTMQTTASALAQKLAGRGVTISNAVLNCPVGAAGTFITTSSNLGLDSGIVLTTGLARSTSGFAGVNGAASSLASINNGAPGDAQLTPLAARPTFDACRLEFDFVPLGDSVRFEYVFSSEEYINSTCGPYNDVFAFFLSGPGITGAPNIALVPGTNIPVAVNSINSGVPGSTGNISNCTAMGPGSPFTSYYVDNSSGTTITHNGFTKVLRAAGAVQPCGTYHLALTIADAGNATYDSGVFLKAGSLQAPSYSVSALGARFSGGDTGIVKGCTPGAFRVRRSAVTPAAKTLHFVMGGDAQPGQDYTAVPDSITIPAGALYADVVIHPLATPVAGTRSLTLFLKASGTCSNAGGFADSATLYIADTAYLRPMPQDTLACAGAKFTLHAGGPDAFYYRWSPPDDLSDASSQNPDFAASRSTTLTVQSSLPGSGCPERNATVSVRVAQPPQVEVSGPSDVCTTGTVTLRAVVKPAGQVGYWTGPGGFSANTAQTTVTPSTAAQGGTYIYHVPVPGCPDAGDSLQLKVYEGLPVPVSISANSLCVNGQEATLAALGFGLQWYTTAQGGTPLPAAPSVNTAQTGVQTFYVSQSLPGCESPRLKLDIPVVECCANQPFVPNAFTPNADGSNDRWVIHPFPHQQLEKVRIFDRWGRVVFVGYNSDSWDGTLYGEAVPAGVYYYAAIVRCEGGVPFEFRGDITLLR